MFELEAVINIDFGGFSLSDEMALWLLENKSWTILDNKEYDYKKKYPVETLLDLGGDMNIHPDLNSDIKFRSNKDLIECVRYFKKVHEDDKYPESYYGKIHSLSIKSLKFSVEIEDYYDGKEKIVGRVDYDFDDLD